MAKKPPKNVNKLIADHQQKPKKKPPAPTLAARFKVRAKPPKKPPKNVIGLIEQALKRKGK